MTEESTGAEVVDINGGKEKDEKAKRAVIIHHVGGSQSTLGSKDTIEYQENALVVTHHDPANTMTVYPWVNIIWLREYDESYGKPGTPVGRTTP